MINRNLTEEQKNMTLGQIQEEKIRLTNEIRTLIKGFTERTGACVTIDGRTNYHKNYDMEEMEETDKLIGVVQVCLDLND